MDLLKTFGGEAKYAIPKIQEALGTQANDVVLAIEASALFGESSSSSSSSS